MERDECELDLEDDLVEASSALVSLITMVGRGSDMVKVKHKG